jgi:hypothetical protein
MNPFTARRLTLPASTENTPAFVLWTIPRSCALRDWGQTEDPMATERWLRAVRATSDAQAEGRLWGDVVVAAAPAGLATQGFSVSAALAPLGGLSVVQQQCQACPANAFVSYEPQALAGCVGFLVAPDDPAFHAEVDRILASWPESESSIPLTAPRWAGLWIARRLGHTDLPLHAALCEQLMPNWGATAIGLHDYHAAVRVALSTGQTLHIQSFPPGSCEGRSWHVPAHCGRCVALWPDARRTRCAVCGQAGGRQASRTRRRMGERPYRVLYEFLTPTEIDQLLRETKSAR